MNPFQFKIPKRHKKCTLCQTPFEDGMRIYSVIKGDEEDAMREDFCEPCFKENANLTDQSWGHWETHLIKPKKKLSLDQRAMELFLEKLEEEDKEWAYFLSQYLRRKKQLVLRSEIKKEGLLFFEDPIQAEVYTVADVNLSAQMLQTLKEQFIQALNPTEEES